MGWNVNDVQKLLEHPTVSNLIEAVTTLMTATAARLFAESQLMESQVSMDVRAEDAEEAESEALRKDKSEPRAPFGYCPRCGEETAERSRSGENVCSNGHIYSNEECLRHPADAETLDLRTQIHRETDGG